MNIALRCLQREPFHLPRRRVERLVEGGLTLVDGIEHPGHVGLADHCLTMHR